MKSTPITARAIHTLMETFKSPKTKTWHEIMKTNILPEFNMFFQLNFDPDIYDCIAGAKLMAYLGFVLPENVVMAVVQKDKLYENTIEVEAMLKKYNDIVQGLSMPQVSTDISNYQSEGLFRIRN